MDRHDNLAFSTIGAAPQQEDIRTLRDRDRESLRRMFTDMRRALVGASHRIAAVPHP